MQEQIFTTRERDLMKSAILSNLLEDVEKNFSKEAVLKSATKLGKLSEKIAHDIEADLLQERAHGEILAEMDAQDADYQKVSE